jgi:hypothetical protein
MKKTTITLICILVITMLISCTYSYPPVDTSVTDEESSTANTDESQPDTINEQDPHGYTYVLKPEASSVIWLLGPFDRDEFDKMTTEEQFRAFDTPEWWVEDFYPAVNEKDEVIDTFETFISYLAHLENFGLTYPVYTPKDLHPKIQISY